MSGAHKIRVPENYRPLGVNNEVRFYFDRGNGDFEKNFCESYGRESAPPSVAPLGRRLKNRFDFSHNLVFL
jgi:hypothetical protein